MGEDKSMSRLTFATESRQAPPRSSAGGLIRALAAALWGFGILAAMAVIGVWKLR